MRALRVALLCCLALAAPAVAQTPTTEREAETLLDRLERELRENKSRMATLEREAAELAEEDIDLRRRLIRASEAVQAREADLSALESRLADLDAREAALRTTLNQGAASRGRLVSGLVRLSRRPPLSWLDPRVDSGDAVRSAVLLRAALPMIRERAEDMRAELANLTALRAEIEDQRRAASVAAEDLQSERARVASLLDERQSRSLATAAEKAETARRLATIAGEARSIEELQAKLERERLEKERRLRAEREAQGVQVASTAATAPARRLNPGQIRGFPRAAAGALSAPVVGRIVRLFGVEDAVGEKTEGIDIRTRPQATVVSPFDGEVVFAGPFGGYGRMLLIRHKGDYFSMLAGMARLDVAVGDVVLEGEPVGLMSGRREDAVLYMELRRRDRPVDPGPWLDRGQGKEVG